MRNSSESKYMQNAMDFYHLLKILVHMELKLLKV